MPEIGRKNQYGVRAIARDIYIFLMGFLFLWYLHVLYTYSSRATPLFIQLLRCASVVLAVWLGQLWKERAWRLLFALWLLLFLRVLIPMPDHLQDRKVREWMFLALWLYSGCFGLARVLTEKQLKRFLSVCSYIWIAAIVVYSAVGIYSAWTDQTVLNLAGKATWKINIYGRLKMLAGQNQSAAIVDFTALIALVLFFCTKKRAVRLLLFISLVIMLVPMCLTGSRTAMYTFSLALGGMAGIMAVRLVDRKKRPSAAVCWITGAVVLVFAAACTVLLLSRITPVFNQAKTGGLILSRAAAESADTGAVELAERELTGLTDREGIWSAVVQHLLNNPILLLTGTSVVDPMGGPNQILLREDAVPHAHNTLLHVLLESGVPGLLLAVAFTVVVGIRIFRLLKNCRTVPLWLSLIAVLVLAVWVGELVECYLIVMRYRMPVLPIAFVCMGVVSAYGRKGALDQPMGIPLSGPPARQ